MKLITLSSLFTGLAVASTTVLAYNDVVQENALSGAEAIVLQAEHKHETEIDDGHGHASESTNENGSESASEEEHEEGMGFSPEKMALANIKVSTLTAKIFAKSVYAPGEIKANGYTSYIVSPRTESVVISRHAILGEHVEKGQALVTLFSESMADAQAEYRVAYSEWQRTKKLGLGTVSESRLLASETAYISAFGRFRT